jgi:aspartate/methionine/tyrosine aminotransferase
MVIGQRHADRIHADALRASVTAARALEAQGRRIARLDIGEPHFPTPPHIVEAAHAAMRAGATKYVSPQGLLELRDAIAASQRARGVSASSDDIVVTPGVKPMLMYALLAVCHSGDEVLTSDPGYPGYAAAARLAGATVRHYPLTHAGESFGVDLDGLRSAITPSTRVLVINSPHNPTGMVLDTPTLEAIAELSLRHDLWVLSDEIYSALTYDRPVPPSIATLPGMRERTIVVDGFSKAYAMTGWRLGYAVLPPRLVATITALVADGSTCTPPFVQHAGVAALTGPQDALDEMRHAYRSRRDALIDQLRAIRGVRAPRPEGALYAFADVGSLMDRATIASSVELATSLLHEHHLACVGGAAFGARGERHVRFSFAVAPDQLDDALARLATWGSAHAT